MNRKQQKEGSPTYTKTTDRCIKEIPRRKSEIKERGSDLKSLKPLLLRDMVRQGFSDGVGPSLGVVFAV